MSRLKEAGVSDLAAEYEDLSKELIKHEIQRFSQIAGAMQPVDAVQSAGAMPPAGVMQSAGAMQLSSPNEFDFVDTGITFHQDTFDMMFNPAEGLMDTDWEWNDFPLD